MVIRLVSCLQSSVSVRSQSIKINNTGNFKAQILPGVPQGSHLDVLRYTNNVKQVFKNIKKAHFFVNGLKFFRFVDSHQQSYFKGISIILSFDVAAVLYSVFSSSSNRLKTTNARCNQMNR